LCLRGKWFRPFASAWRGGADGFWCRWVQTELGQVLADAIGFPEPPMSVEESARGVLEQVCFFLSWRFGHPFVTLLTSLAGRLTA
jgi:hypothetical protein